MDLRNWEFTTLGSAVAGADVYVYEASLTHPNPNSPLASTTTDSNGMWAFTGLSNTAKDVKVEYQSKAKWYKGLTRHSVGVVFVDDHETTDFTQFVGQASVAAPAAGLGRAYFKTDGKLYGQYGAGGEFQVADYAGADAGEVLKQAGWGQIVDADVSSSAAIAVTKLAGAPYVKAVATADQDFTSGSVNTLQFAATEIEDATGMHSTASNTDRINILTDGVYVFIARAAWEHNANGVRQLDVMLSTGLLLEFSRVAPVPAASGDLTIQEVVAISRMTAGQYATCRGYQTSGTSPLKIKNSVLNAWFAAYRLGG